MDTVRVILMIAASALVLTALLYAVIGRRWSFGQSVLWVVVILLVPLLGSVVFLVVDHMRANDRRRAATG
ncbi:hypothetical protein [Plantactinospora sp. CA-290183]|uniref:hypothetical protein n=1 Tax=Plantactinospora sp. CA-290183 TaxID=3240006 RepID=UPI003D8D047A